MKVILIFLMFNVYSMDDIFKDLPPITKVPLLEDFDDSWFDNYFDENNDYEEILLGNKRELPQDEGSRKRVKLNEVVSKVNNVLDNSLSSSSSSSCVNKIKFSEEYKKGNWTNEEEDLLIKKIDEKLVELGYSKKDLALKYSLRAKFINTFLLDDFSMFERRRKQISEKVETIILKDYDKMPWSIEEENNLLRLYIRHKGSWSTMIKTDEFPYRSAQKLKNKHQILMKKNK